MARFEATKANLVAGGACLAALLRGEEGIDADAGALVLADAIDCLRVVRKALTKKGARG